MACARRPLSLRAATDPGEGRAETGAKAPAPADDPPRSGTVYGSGSEPSRGSGVLGGARLPIERKPQERHFRHRHRTPARFGAQGNAEIRNPAAGCAHHVGRYRDSLRATDDARYGMVRAHRSPVDAENPAPDSDRAPRPRAAAQERTQPLQVELLLRCEEGAVVRRDPEYLAAEGSDGERLLVVRSVSGSHADSRLEGVLQCDGLPNIGTFRSRRSWLPEAQERTRT